MRIISGKYGGRPIDAPRTKAIRPTSDKVRGAIMNMLTSHGAIEGARVIDGFCGTGALGLEALSRGARSCLFIDQNPTSLELAKTNAGLLKIGETGQFLLKDLTRLGEITNDQAPKSLVFLDPPYNEDLVYDALESLHTGGWLKKDAFVVVEEDQSYEPDFPEAFEVLNDKTHGDTKVILLSHKGA